MDVNNDGVIGLVESKADPLHKNFYVQTIWRITDPLPVIEHLARYKMKEAHLVVHLQLTQTVQTSNKKRNEEKRRYYLFIRANSPISSKFQQRSKC